MLGHLVKPGQFDPKQIDAQIGSGIVQVTDVEFNHDVLNEKLRLAQIPFVLESGSLGKVTANLPWPNLLTAPVALSLSSLNITLSYSPAPRSSSQAGISVDGISESVEHMAQSFVHDELHSTETSKSPSTSENISYKFPGTFDPNNRGDSDPITARDDEELATQGVSLIATLIEKLLSRFKFDVSDIRVNIIFPEATTLSFYLDRVAYKTEDAVEQTIKAGEREKGEVRTLSLGKFIVSMKVSSPVTETLSSSTVSSDNDDENMAMMSQSLAALPPRDRAPSAAEASIYHSLLSTLPETEVSSFPHLSSNEEQRILSMGHGTDSILATMVTPSLRISPDALPLGPHIALDITISPLLLSLNPSQVAVILDIISLFDQVDSPTPAVTKAPSRTVVEDCVLNIHIANIACILWDSSLMSTELHIINTLHARSPACHDLLIPHLRISFNNLNAKLSLSRTRSHHLQYHFQGCLEDFSTFSFSYGKDRSLLVSAVLVSDSSLDPQYDPDDMGILPIFNITGLTRDTDVQKASTEAFWRRHSSRSKSEKHPVVRIHSQTFEETTIKIDIPLHIFVDIETIQFVNSYITRMTDFKKIETFEPKIEIPKASHTEGMASSAYIDQDNQSGGDISVQFLFIRIETSVSPISQLPESRSGNLALDLHNFHISRGREKNNSSPKLPAKVLGMFRFKKVIAALALPNDVKAEAFLVVDSLEDVSKIPSACFRTVSPMGSMSIDIVFPFLNISLSKPVLRGLVYWLDDFSRWAVVSSPEKAVTLPNSKYSLKRTASLDSSVSSPEDLPRKPELAVRLSIDEGKIHLLVPRSKDNDRSQSLVILLMNTEILAEISPEGKNENVITLGVGGIDITDKYGRENSMLILHSAQPHNKHSTRPLIKLRYVSIVEDVFGHKSSKIKLSFFGFIFHLYSESLPLLEDLQSYFKSPEGVFDTVVPNERTTVSLAIVDGSIEVSGSNTSGSAIVHIGELEFGTAIVNESPEINLKARVLSSAVLFVDNKQTLPPALTNILDSDAFGASYWKSRGYALFTEIDDGEGQVSFISSPSPRTEVHVNRMKIKLHACADTLSAFTAFIGSMTKEEHVEVVSKPSPVRIDTPRNENLLASLDEEAFSRLPSLGPTADMINDDLPTNPDYLDVSYGTAGGLREIDDNDLLDFENEPKINVGGVISNFGGETVRMLNDKGITIIDQFFENIVPEPADVDMPERSKIRIRAENCDLTFLLYEGYDWLSTRQLIEEEIKLMRRRLLKIKQLLAEGQNPDYSIENTNTLLFNSVSIGLLDDSDDMEPPALIAAIDRTLQDDENASESSWQSFTSPPNNPSQPTRSHGSRLLRSRNAIIEFCFRGIRAEVDVFDPAHELLSKVLVAAKDVEILDHVKTSTWKKFLSQLRVDFQGNFRQTDSDMVRAELRLLRSVPNPDIASKEGRFRLKILPIKLNVDQDALDFMKRFFSFQPSPNTDDVAEPNAGLYFQHVEVFPVDLKLDYKPKRVDYRALRQGKTIELMNFFHFDGSEITLRHITLSGITGWGRLFETLNDLWTPDVKANQLADIISGVSPIRSFVNVGSGVADLVLLPIAQYKKDKRLVRGVQKGTAAFMKNTAMEAVKLGARLATGTQVILEQAETVLGGQGQFRHAVTTEALQLPDDITDETDMAELISRYADQPQNVREGFHSAYRSLSRNFHSAAQTILAVPMEVYERSGNEGPVHAVVRAVPIAVLKPMIGASEAVSKALFGLRNTLDPEARHDNEAKYKHR